MIQKSLHALEALDTEYGYHVSIHEKSINQNQTQKNTVRYDGIPSSMNTTIQEPVVSISYGDNKNKNKNKNVSGGHTHKGLSAYSFIERLMKH